MGASADRFYSEERWGNWLQRLREADLGEEEELARLLFNLQNDVAIAIAKIISASDEGELDEAGARGELTAIRDLVLADPDLDNEEAAMLIDGIQTSLVCVLLAAEQYLAAGADDDAGVEELLSAAAEAEAEGEFDRALELSARAGTRVIDGEDLDAAALGELDYFVTEWVTGLDSLQGALSDPEVVEEGE